MKFANVPFATKRRPMLGAMAAMLTLTFAFTAATMAQVMEQVPQDALAVLRVRDLKTTSGKLGKFLTDLGVGAMIPGANDPLNFLQVQTNMQKGLNSAGEMAVIYRDPDVTGADPEKSMVILIPVSDYAAFVSNFQQPKVDGDVTEVQMPKGGSDPGFLANWGAFAALSPAKEAVAKKPTAMLKINAMATNKDLGSKDIVLFANFVALRAKYMSQLQAHKDEILAVVERTASGDEKMAKAAPVLKSVVSQGLWLVESYLRDTDAATISLNFGAEGINVSMMSEFTPNSYLGNMASSFKNTSEPLLRGLPTGKYLVYGGSVNDPACSKKLVDDFTGPIKKEIAAAGPDMQPINDYIDALMEYMAANRGNTFGVATPSGQIGADPILQFVSIARGDAPKLRDAQHKMMKSQEELMKAFGMPADTMKSTVTPNAKTVEGIPFDLMTTAVNPDAKSAMAQQQAQVMQMMYGPEGMKMLSGEVQGNLVVASGINDALLGSTITAIKSDASPLSGVAGTKSVAANLPKSRIAEVYIPVDEIVTTGLNYAKQFGAGINMQLPPELPPIGASLLSDGSAVRIEAYVPSALVQSLIAAGMQAAMQMQGGGGGGGRGL